MLDDIVLSGEACECSTLCLGLLCGKWITLSSATVFSFGGRLREVFL